MDYPTKTTSRRTRALAKLSGWLKASKIAHEPTHSSLKVTAKDGSEVIVAILDGRTAPAGVIGVDLEGIWSRDMEEALETFHKLTQALGYGSPQPVPDRKMSGELDFHAYWMRHTEVAVSPNPDPAVFKQYEPIINVRVRRFCCNMENKSLLWELGMDHEDVRSIAMMWVVSYEGLHKVLLSTDHDNEKLLHSHLTQRFAELHGRLKSQVRDAGFRPIPDDTMFKILEYKSSSDTENVEMYEEESELSVLDDAKNSRERKKGANGLLRTALKKMPKSIAIKKLEDIATRPGVDADVAAKAIEHLNRMTKKKSSRA